MKVRGAQAGMADLHHTGSGTPSPTSSSSTAARSATSSGLAGWPSDVMLERYGASAADARAKSTAQRKEARRPGMNVNPYEMGRQIGKARALLRVMGKQVVSVPWRGAV